MEESVANNLIHVGINFGFTLFFIGVVWVVVICIIKCYKHDDHHEHNNNDDHVNNTTMGCVGIKPYVLRSIPIVEFNSKDFKDVVECVVCLSELVNGDKARVLQSCDHCFHAQCIDTWLQSHSICPICRKRVCLEQRRTRPELGGGDESLTRNHDMNSSPRITDTAVVEDADCGGASEGPPELTEVVIDIPEKEI